MRLTRFGFRGAVFYVAMLGAFFAAPYSNLFFLLLGFLTLLGASGLLASRRNLRDVKVGLGNVPPVPACTALRVVATLEASRPARYQLKLVLELAGGHVVSGQADLLDGQANVRLEAEPLSRGCHAVQRAYLESTYPFGFVRVRRAIAAPEELVVYPAPRGHEDGRSAVEALEELLDQTDPGAGDLQPSSLRDHHEGDGVRAIHWRASARRGRLVVQEWEGGSGLGFEVVLDRRCSEDELEDALSTISALLSVARTNKETLRFHSQELSATFGEGHLPWSVALRFLAITATLPDDAPAPPATSPGVMRLPRSTSSARRRSIPA